MYIQTANIFTLNITVKRDIRDTTHDKIEKNEMGVACGTYGGRERCAQGFGGET